MEITENALVARLRRFGSGRDDIIRGIGDDCAAVHLSEGTYVFTQDALVERVHFDLSLTGYGQLGEKSIYVNVSDILSMGATPLYYMVTVGLPDRVPYKSVATLYRGMERGAAEFGAVLIGGDTVASPSALFIDVSMVGRLVSARLLRRDNAKAGDLVGVTGYLGESAYGLHLLEGHRKERGSVPFVKRYRSPRPPYEVWKELVKHGIPNAMMDVSDGLLIDLERMMTESKKGAKIMMEAVPVPPKLIREHCQEMALAGGEDYQLLFTFSRQKLGLIARLRQDGHHLSVIGEVTGGRGVKLYQHGKRIHPVRKGYEHFGVDR